MFQVDGYNQNNVYRSNYLPVRYDGYPYSQKTSGTVAKENENMGKTVILAGLLQLLSSSLAEMSRRLGNKLAAGKEFTTAENVQRVSNDMIKNNNLDVTVEYISPENLPKMEAKYRQAGLRDVAEGKNAFFSPSQKLAVAPKSKPSLLPHELGHAANAKSKFWSVLQKSKQYSMLAPVAALILSKVNTNTDGKPNFVERNAGILGFAAFLPTIVEEGKASLRGIQQAKKTLAKEIKAGNVSLKALKRNYLTAWLTYVLAGIGLGVATKYSVLEEKLGAGR